MNEPAAPSPESPENSSRAWSADGYQKHAAFVPALGQPLLGLLAPKTGERILDLGCGDGVLTRQIADLGASVVGVDSAPDMVRAARALGLDARVADGLELAFDGEFDAVFSNAALHWMTEPKSVLRGVHRALRPRGRFVAEFGGHGCVASIVVAIRAVLERRGVSVASPWYFPAEREYRAELEAAGFTVERLELFPRLTPIPSLDGWLETFAEPFFAALPESDRAAAAREIGELLRPVLCDREGRWTADYVRIRFIARA
jgi:SAM-dependent methyltransferase